MGRPKLELLTSNGVATFVMPFSITLNARHIKRMHTCIHRHTHAHVQTHTRTCTDTSTHIIQTQSYTRTHTSHRHTHTSHLLLQSPCLFRRPKKCHKGGLARPTPKNRLPARGTPGGVVVGWCGRVEVKRGKRIAGLDGIGVGPTTKAAPVADGELYRWLCMCLVRVQLLPSAENVQLSRESPEIAVFSSDLVASAVPS